MNSSGVTGVAVFADLVGYTVARLALPFSSFRKTLSILGQLMHILVETLFYTFFTLVGCTVARFALPLLSFGKVYVQPINAPPKKFNGFGYRYDESGRIEIESTFAGFIGVIICLIIFLCGLLIRTGF